MSAELMLAQIYRLIPGAIINFVELSDERCVIEAQRPGGKVTTFKFDTSDAQKADLLGKNNWKQYPRAMRRSRCVSEMARTLFPDALMGVSHTPEELNSDLQVTEDGEVIDITPEKKTPAPSAPEAEINPPKTKPIGSELGKVRAPVMIGKIPKHQTLQESSRVDIEEALSKLKGVTVAGPIRNYLDQAQEYLSWLDEVESYDQVYGDPEAHETLSP